MRTTTIRAAIAAITIAASAVLPASAVTNITESVTLTEDTDWTEFGTVTVAEGVTIDLNGHSLTVAGLAGTGSIVDSQYNPEYTRLSYIESSGSTYKQGAYIDTGYIHDNSTKVDMRIQFDNVGLDYQCFYGARNSTTDTAKGFSLWLTKAQFRRAFGA